MILVRSYASDDQSRIRALHAAQGLNYELPDLESPSLLVRGVIEENGQITNALFLRKTSEAYWIFDPTRSKRQRLGDLLILSKEMLGPAKRMGIEDVHAFLPPEILDQKLERTLFRLGWVKPLWTCYSRKVE